MPSRLGEYLRDFMRMSRVHHGNARRDHEEPGEDVIIAGSVDNEEARRVFGGRVEPKPCIRIVPQPKQRRRTMPAMAECGPGGVLQHG